MLPMLTFNKGDEKKMNGIELNIQVVLYQKRNEKRRRKDSVSSFFFWKMKKMEWCINSIFMNKFATYGYYDMIINLYLQQVMDHHR
jgi:hypothetical protein